MDNYRALKETLESIQSPSILVIGDLMLDRYSWGNVSRISPEAPIPVLKVKREENRLGGAANAMTNLGTLGAKVYACGVIGKDSNGQIIKGLLDELKVDSEGVFQQEGFTTILKHRMIAGHHHLLRMDFDPASDSETTCEPEIINYLKNTIPDVSLILISDYGKNILTTSILDCIRTLSKEHDLPVLVDPKQGADYQTYQDFTLIKPNRLEAIEIVGNVIIDIESALDAAEKIQKDYNIKYVVLSLDRDGLLLFENRNSYTHFAAETQEVFDVVGAGDMVVSVLSLLLAGDASIEHAVAWANIAAGMEITHVGVVSFTKEELLHKLSLGQGVSKVVTVDYVVSQLQHQPSTVIFTNGYFDNISSAHLKFLQQLQKFKGICIVAINSDQSIKQQKGTLPLLNEKERASLLSSIENIDWIIIFDGPDANHLIQTIKPSIIVKGGANQRYPLVEQPIIEEIGATVHYLPKFE